MKASSVCFLQLVSQLRGFLNCRGPSFMFPSAWRTVLCAFFSPCPSYEIFSTAGGPVSCFPQHEGQFCVLSSARVPATRFSQLQGAQFHVSLSMKTSSVCFLHLLSQLRGFLNCRGPSFMFPSAWRLVLCAFFSSCPSYEVFWTAGGPVSLLIKRCCPTKTKVGQNR
jgi:hypothetical protein